MKQIWLLIILVVIALMAASAVVSYYFGFNSGLEKANQQKVDSFEECVAAGNPVLESYPEQCMTPDGRNFTRQVELRPDDSDRPVACTMEAKICPDGSAVGRTGPNCEFAPCPGE